MSKSGSIQLKHFHWVVKSEPSCATQFTVLDFKSNCCSFLSLSCLYHKQTVYWAAGHHFFISVRALSFKSCIRDGENHSRIVWRLLFLKPNLNLISWCKGTRTPFISNLGTEEMPCSRRGQWRGEVRPGWVRWDQVRPGWVIRCPGLDFALQCWRFHVKPKHAEEWGCCQSGNCW